jgi:hypothetical protein
VQGRDIYSGILAAGRDLVAAGRELHSDPVRIARMAANAKGDNMKDSIKIDEFLVQRMDDGGWLVTTDGGLALKVMLGELLREVFIKAFQYDEEA